MLQARRALLGALMITAAAGATASAAPPTQPVSDPPLPAAAPVAAGEALQMLRGRVDGRRLTLELRCSRSGRLELKAGGRSFANIRFACRGSRARFAVKLPATAARRIAAGRAETVRASASVNGWQTSFTLKLTRRVRAQAASDPGTIINGVWCTHYGFQASVDTATHFGAGYGEQVWWRPVGWQYETQSWSTQTYISPHGFGDNLWDTYVAVPDYSWFRGVFYANASVRALGLWTTRRGVWVKPAIQWYSRARGYEWRWVGATTSTDYGENPVEWCHVTY